ncbi:hypothetical protein SOVF_128250 [Spinacia oleracea]|nr:hypothetical protein SOVF_128250 [Spinacia oleracea]
MRDFRSKFLDVFQVLKSELFDDPAFELIDFSRQWVDNTFTLELKNYIEVCMFAANNGVILRQRIPRVLRKHFRDKKYYVDLLHLFDQVEFQTAGGQMNNLLITLEDEKDLSKYSSDLYGRIVHYKTANYSFYLPVACALLMSGEKLEDHLDTKSILMDMGKYLQVQGVFAEYECQNYESLIISIEACPSAAVQVLLKSLLAEVYKRQN